MEINIAGHGRIAAALSLGLHTVPTIAIEGLTQAQIRAYVLSDNRLAEEAGWDRALLAVELGELATLLPLESLDLTATGFELSELEPLLHDLCNDGSDPTDVPPAPLAEAVTRRGDLWELGPHKVLCGDAQSESDLRKVMLGELARAAITDPPYNVPISGHVLGRGRNSHAEFAFGSGEMSKAEFIAFLRRALSCAALVSHPGAVHYVFMDWRHISELFAAAGDVYEVILNLAVWVKTNAGQGSFYRSQHEHVGVFRVGGARHQNNVELGKHGRNRSNVWTYPGVNSFGAGRDDALAMHPTVKPVALVADAMRDCTTRGDLVLDPFLGSGTTLMAAEKVGRRARGVEYEPKFVDVTIRRWQDFARRDAILHGDGRTFAEIQEIRGVPGSGPDSDASFKAANYPGGDS